MKRVANLDVAKNTVQNLLGKRVRVRLNKGRNKVKNYDGVVQELHSNVFVVKLLDDALFDRISCSYIDMLCGEVALCEISTN